MASKFDLPSDPGKLVPFLENMVERGLDHRRPRDWGARINLAFVNGDQWLIVDAKSNRLERVRIDEDDPNAPILISINKIGGHVDRLIAKLTKSSPVPEGRPVSNDEDDVSSARVTTRILASECERIDLQTLLPRLYYWVLPVGWAYAQVCWHADLPPILDHGVPMGQIDVEIVPHFELVVDPSAKTLEEARWACRTIALTPEEIYERWGKEVKAGSNMTSLADDLHSLRDYSPHRRHASAPDRMAVRQFWLRPGGMRSRPKGMTITYAGNTILEDAKDFPYEHGCLPFVQFNYLPPQGTSFGRTIVDDLIPMQMDYNDQRSREADLRRSIVPKMIAPKRAIDVDMMTTRMEVIEYEQVGNEPHYELPDASWTTQWEIGMKRAAEEMGERSGINEAATGGLTGTSPAATVMAQQEAAAEPLAIPAKELAKSIKMLGYQMIELARQYWTEKRIVRTWSEAGTLEVDRFSKSNIKGQFDVHVSAESALPRSKAGRATLMMELYKGEVIDSRQLIRSLDLPQTDVIADNYNRDVREAEEMLGEMVRGKVVPVQMWQAHDVHLQVINDFRKTREYRKLDDRKKGIIEASATVREMLIGGAMAGPGQAAMGGPAMPYTPDPTQVAAGEQPGAPVPPVTQLAQIGQGAGTPGPVPGIDMDTQAALMGQ